MLSYFLSLLRKTYTLVRPYGLKRLAIVMFFILSQGLFQIVGVTSIFPFLKMASDPSGLRQSHLAQKVLQHLPPMTDQQMLIWAGVLVIVALLFSNVMNVVSERVRTLYAYNFGHWLSMRLLWRYLTRPYGYFLETHSGVMMKKVTGDVGQFTRAVLLALLDSMTRLVVAALLFATLIAVSWQIAVIGTAVITIYYVAIFALLRGGRRRISEGLNRSTRGKYMTLQHLFGGIKPILVHDARRHFADGFAEHSLESARMSSRAPLYSGLPRYLVEPMLFGGMVVFLIILIAQGKTIESVMAQMGVMAFAGYRMLPTIQLLYAQLSDMDTMRHCLDEVYAEFLIAEEAGAKAEELQHDTKRVKAFPLRQAIRLESVEFSYPRSVRPAVNGVSVEILKGSTVAFVGPSGSGKSTLVDLIIGLHAPNQGRIVLDNTELNGKTMRSWRQAIGYVPQDIFLLDASLAENIAFGYTASEIDTERLKRVTEQAQLGEFIKKELPDGFKTRVGERGARLSGGQRQRVGLARALYHNPQVLILDEATSALDNRTEEAFMRSIDSLHGQLTIIMIAHRFSTIRSCDTIFFLEEGGLVSKGSYNDLLRDCASFAELARKSEMDTAAEATTLESTDG